MIEASTPITVTMIAERWEQVIALLRQVLAPHNVTDPLIREINGQCLAFDRPEGFRPPPFPRPHVVEDYGPQEPMPAPPQGDAHASD